MFGAEPLKASNTGRLIADILPDTQAFLWSRTEVDPPCWRPSNDPTRQPLCSVPASYADAERPVFNELPVGGNRRCSSCWTAPGQKARKMFNSPYLNQFPVFHSTSMPHPTISCAKPAAPSTARRMAAALLQQAGDLPAADG